VAKKKKPPPKRQRDLVREFEQAVADAGASFEIDPTETYEQAAARVKAYLRAHTTAIPRMMATLKARERGFARSAGRAASGRAPARTRTLCDALARQFPRDIARFKSGKPLPESRLREMVRAVTGTKRPPSLDALRRQLTRQFRDGEKAAALRNRERTGGSVAKRLDVRHGVIQPPPPLDIYELFPGLRLIKVLK